MTNDEMRVELLTAFDTADQRGKWDILEKARRAAKYPARAKHLSLVAALPGSAPSLTPGGGNNLQLATLVRASI